MTTNKIIEGHAEQFIELAQSLMKYAVDRKESTQDLINEAIFSPQNKQNVRNIILFFV